MPIVKKRNNYVWTPKLPEQYPPTPAPFFTGLEKQFLFSCTLTSAQCFDLEIYPTVSRKNPCLKNRGVFDNSFV